MNIRDIPRAEGDSTTMALLAAATALLAKDRPEIPAEFLGALFGHAAPDDLVHYTPEQLAAIAAQSWLLLLARPADTPKLRFEPAAETPGVALLEILDERVDYAYELGIEFTLHRTRPGIFRNRSTRHRPLPSRLLH